MLEDENQKLKNVKANIDRIKADMAREEYLQAMKAMSGLLPEDVQAMFYLIMEKFYATPNFLDEVKKIFHDLMVANWHKY